jgi:hypothetical protein
MLNVTHGAKVVADSNALIELTIQMQRTDRAG